MDRITIALITALVFVFIPADSQEQESTWIIIADDDFSNTGFWETDEDENLAVFYNKDWYQIEVRQPMPSMYGILPQTPPRVMGGFRASVTFALHERQVIGIALQNADDDGKNPTGWVMAFAQSGGYVSLVHGHIDKGFTTEFREQSSIIEPGELITLTLTMIDDQASVALNDQIIRSHYTIAQPIGFQPGLAFQSKSPDAPITLTRFVYEVLQEND